MTVRLGAFAAFALAALALAAPALAQGPVLGPPVSVDGPSPDITGRVGLSVARDGTGGLVYLKAVAGVQHVFVSRLAGGGFQPPEQLDSTLAGASSAPVIAAGDGGLLLIAFINAGQLYVVDRASLSSSFGAPSDLFDGAGSPALQVSTLGKAYLAFTATGAGGHDVRSAYYYRGRWSVESSPLDALPADDAGTGVGRPQVAAAGDGVGIVVWGETGHVFSRRVVQSSPSVVYEQADVPSLSGWTEVAAGEPTVGTGGDSSYADIAFQEVLANGTQQQSRVLMRRLRGSADEGVTQPDGLSTPSGDGADQPQVAFNEYGRGVVTSSRVASNELFATVLGSNGSTSYVARVDSLRNATPPDAVTGTTGLYSDLVAWQQDPGLGGGPEIRARFLSNSSFGPELIVSSPSLGPTDAARGLAVGGDLSGDGVIAWVQGSGAGTRILVAGLYQAPGSPAPVRAVTYAPSGEPVLAWTPARELLGPLAYAVTLDGVPIGQTTSTSLAVPRPLSDGPHRWQVTAYNGVGEKSSAATATVFVDTVAPSARVTLRGVKRTGSSLHAYVSYADAPPAPETPADASGVAGVLINWGDGASFHIQHAKSHVYRRPGRYRLTVLVVDRAGNRKTVARTITIASKPRKVSSRGHRPPLGHHR
ncbi:MAG: hypothetical protein ACR2IP_02970 [Solirubrobacteraceae bacterium]